MNGIPQLPSAILVLAFTAVTLVAGPLFIELIKEVVKTAAMPLKDR
jgi:hypothetical protein